MNSSDIAANSVFDGSKASGIGYAIGISVGILLLIRTITLASYFCSQANMPTQNIRRSELADEQVMDIEAGIDEETLRRYPKVTYSDAKMQRKSTTASCCSICLADYKDTDMLRLLQECRHLFHLKCVDPWLRLHPTCPICRTSPALSPFLTPLAAVLSMRQTS